MKESDESPAYEAKHHDVKFLRRAEGMAKHHLDGKHEEKMEHDGKKHHGHKGGHKKDGKRKHHGK